MERDPEDEQFRDVYKTLNLLGDTDRLPSPQTSEGWVTPTTHLACLAIRLLLRLNTHSLVPKHLAAAHGALEPPCNRVLTGVARAERDETRYALGELLGYLEWAVSQGGLKDLTWYGAILAATWRMVPGFAKPDMTAIEDAFQEALERGERFLAEAGYTNRPFPGPASLLVHLRHMLEYHIMEEELDFSWIPSYPCASTPSDGDAELFLVLVAYSTTTPATRAG